MYRFSGFAIHSLLETRKNKSTNAVELLNTLKCHQDEIHEVPEQVKDLGNTQNFCIVTPRIIPYVQLLVKVVTSNINEQQMKAHGHEMIKLAKKKIIVNHQAELRDKFRQCVSDIEKSRCLQESDEVIAAVETVRKEFSDIIFNSRVNEFFKARKELELELTKKACDCDQSLRDSLKTFSSIKTRV